MTVLDDLPPKWTPLVRAECRFFAIRRMSCPLGISLSLPGEAFSRSASRKVATRKLFCKATVKFSAISMEYFSGSFYETPPFLCVSCRSLNVTFVRDQSTFSPAEARSSTPFFKGIP